MAVWGRNKDGIGTVQGRYRDVIERYRDGI